MKCLAVNTATSALSVALAEDSRILHLFELNETRDQAGKLFGYINDTLKACNVTYKDLNLLTSVTGPGSFTGIRVGLAAMRGLALATGLPLCGISSFEMFAIADDEDNAINIIAVESWRDEIYFSVRDASGNTLIEESSETPESFQQRFRASPLAGRNIVISGDAAAAIASLFPEAVICDRLGNAGDAALIAIRNTAKGASVEALPYYMRSADVTISHRASKRIGS